MLSLFLAKVYVRIRDTEWNVYRRYSQFFDLHQSLRKKDPIVNSFDFPPKKTVGNMGERFVEDRRRALQSYLRCIVNYLVRLVLDMFETSDFLVRLARLVFDIFEAIDFLVRVVLDIFETSDSLVRLARLVVDIFETSDWQDLFLTSWKQVNGCSQVTTNVGLSTCPDKATLLTFLPFFADAPDNSNR